MKRCLLTVVAFLVAASALHAQSTVAGGAWAEPVDRNAIPEARALLHEIDALSGHYTLTGQHNFPNHVSRWSDRVYDLTGKYPVIFGSDFGFSGGDDKDSTEGRPSMIAEVERQYRNGAVIALCWHAVKPSEDEPVTFHDSVQGKLTDFEWDELLTPGSDLNKRWMTQVDVIAGYLQQLQAAGVPVLFRPYHEMNGNWFWWGGRPGAHGSAELYRMIYDRYVNYHHLHNLVWVWNVNAPSGNAGDLAAYDPGHPYADLYTIDIYGEFKQSYYDQMLTLAGNKPVALAEVGVMPTLTVIAQQPRWAYFMMWSGSAEGNPPDLLQANFHAPNLLTRGDAALAPYAPAPAGKQIAAPVSRNATAQAKALLGKLYEASGSTVLSGQQDAISTAISNASTEQVFAATGKYPAIYAAELAGADEKTLIAEVKRQHAAGSIVNLRWTAPLPTTGTMADTMNDAPGDKAGSKAATLSNFEWTELLTPGTDLNSRWLAQVDTLAAELKQLQDAGIPVMFDPYPESNGKQYWWAGRPGIHGSAELYRMLFERLADHHRLGNLVWIWTAAPGGFGPAGPAGNGTYGDYFPGLLYADAVAVQLQQPPPGQARGRLDAFVSSFAVGKAIGISFARGVPGPELFAAPSKWSWFLLAPAADGNATDKLKALYGDTSVSVLGMKSGTP